MFNNLPPNWSWVKLGDVAEFIYGKGLIKGERNTNGKFPVYGSNGIVGFHNAYLVEGPCLIVGRKGAAGEVHFSTKNCWPIDTTYYVKSSVKYSINYLYYILKNLRLESLDKSTAIPGLNRNDAYKLSIPLPPLPEQKKIVEKIEELFGGLDSGVGSLKKAKEQIRLYRQSVLASAFSGRLHQDSQDLKINKIKTESAKSFNPDNHGSDNLPDGWKWVKLGEVIDSMQYGTSDKAVGSDEGVPVLRMGNIQDGKLDYSSLKYFEKDYKDLNKYLLEDGDLLFNRTNSAELVGKSALYKKYFPKSIFASYLIRVKANRSIYLPEFLNYYINSSFGREFIKSVVSQNVGQANVNGTKLKNMDVPLVPLNQQTQIVEEIEKRFSEADNLEKAIDESLTKSETLRQSILKKAFEGKLV